MSEPVSSTAVATYGLGLTVLMGTVSEIPAGVFTGAFAGSVVYVLTNSDIPTFKRLCFFLISFIVGILGSEYAANLMTALTAAWMPTNTVVDRSIGAIVASAVAIKIILALIAKTDIPAFRDGK